MYLASAGYPIHANESLHRLRRHISFINIWNGSVCYYPENFKPNSSELCHMVQINPSCGYFVYFIDYLKLLFCTFNLDWDSSYIFILAIPFLLMHYVLYMIVKYFCVPNFMELMDLVPISEYAYSFIYFGFCLYVPSYLITWLNCRYCHVCVASLIFSATVGDILRTFVVGVLVLCIGGYHVNGVIWWCNMSFIFVGITWIMQMVRTKYELFGATDLAYADTHLLQYGAWTLLWIFWLMMLVVFILSYQTQRKHNSSVDNKTEEVSSEGLSDLASDVDMAYLQPKREDLNKYHIWVSTVNGYANMKERYKFVVIIFTPVYFILANIVPVLDKHRPMHGWCKPVVCLSFLVFPFLFIGLKPGPKVWISVLICSWAMAFTVGITTHSLREPSHVWLCIYSITGMITCSVSMHVIFYELDNLTWQYMSMRFHPLPDLICLLCFHSADALVLVIVLVHLIRFKLLDAAYGVVMSVVTYNTYMAVPEIVLTTCYNENTFIESTAHAETCLSFFLVIFFGTLFHVSMSGNQFRMSLFYYLLFMLTAFIVFQLSVYNEWVHPFGTLHTIKPPFNKIGHWA